MSDFVIGRVKKLMTYNDAIDWYDSSKCTIMFCEFIGGRNLGHFFLLGSGFGYLLDLDSGGFVNYLVDNGKTTRRGGFLKVLSCIELNDRMKVGSYLGKMPESKKFPVWVFK